MAYDLGRAASILLDHKKSKLDRAVELYRFKIAVLFSRSFEEDDEKDGVHVRNISFRNAPKYARRFAAAKLLAHLQTELMEQGSARGSLSALRKNRDYKNLSNKLITKYGGWRGLVYLPSMREFDKAISLRINGSKAIAMSVDVSSRFAQRRPQMFPPKFRVGKTRALTAIIKSSDYKPNLEVSRLKTLSREHGNGAGFLYLQHFHAQSILKPQRLMAATFAAKLLSEADNLDKLRGLFEKHEKLAELLGKAGYKLPRVDIAFSSAELKLSPLTPETISALS